MGRYAHLVMVSSENNNKFYTLTEQANGMIDVEYGRVDSTSSKTTYPISKWNSIYNSKILKGYKDITDLVATKEIVQTSDDGTEKVNYISDSKDVELLIRELQAFATSTIQQNYKISSNKVTQKMIDVAQGLVDNLSFAYKNGDDYNSLNKILLEIYTTIPRRMSDVRSYLFKSDDKKAIERIIDNEQKLLDTMAGQVLANISSNDKDDVTEMEQHGLLDRLGLKVDLETSEDILSLIRQMMGESSNLMGKVYKVSNLATEERYNKAFGADTESKEELLWHGSRNQNWFNILQTGLLIRPAGAVYSGSMFSDGIYFANKARKSIGYSSLSGSYWARGSANKSFLAVFSVNVGNQRHIYRHDSSCYSITEKNLLPFNSVYAHGGADLRNDEFIIYNPNRCTIKYLVEIKQ